MDTLSLVLSFIFGAVIGSFLNVVSLRFNTGTGIGGRSKCMSCGTTLTWKELIPLLSFTMQKGTCKRCKSKISWQYPLVEFMAGALFVLIFITFPPTSVLSGVTTLIYVIASCLLIVIAAYDIKHKIIPDQFVYAFALLSLVNLCVGGTSWLHVPSISAFVAGPLLAFPFAFLWVVSKGRWMGLGDAKLVLGIGWFLGIGLGINALILSFWIAAVISVIWLFATYKRFKTKTEIPFGPYLILGMYLVLIFRIELLDVNLIRELLVAYL
jgi:leader peptidase (prepilin peptidase)/N-methyltransferase